jgi:hypothetical protein
MSPVIKNFSFILLNFNQYFSLLKQTTKLTNKPKLISNKLVNYDSSNIKKTSGTPAFLLSTPSSPIISKTKTFTNYRQMTASASIDNRPKELLINEIENEEEKTSIVNHFRVRFSSLNLFFKVYKKFIFSPGV